MLQVGSGEAAKIVGIDGIGLIEQFVSSVPKKSRGQLALVTVTLVPAGPSDGERDIVPAGYTSKMR
jgi:hypothetical protein